MKYGLLGHPLGHSMSPFIHKQLTSVKNAPCQYDLYDFTEEQLLTQSALLLSLDGFNVTIPYKKRVISLLDRLDETAARYDSVNVVKTGKENIGYNTDVTGFIKSVQNAGMSLKGNVLMLGGGGVARMMGVETALAGGKLTIAVRDTKAPKVQSLVETIKALSPLADVTVVDISSVDGVFDFIINATPVGMYPNVDASPAREDLVKRCGGVFDAIYNPRDTLLAKYAHKHDVPCVTGMEMLVRQAAEAQTIWQGLVFDDDEIKDVIDKANREMESR